jgi:hypothetical protein
MVSRYPGVMLREDRDLGSMAFLLFLIGLLIGLSLLIVLPFFIAVLGIIVAIAFIVALPLVLAALVLGGIIAAAPAIGYGLAIAALVILLWESGRRRRARQRR